MYNCYWHFILYLGENEYDPLQNVPESRSKSIDQNSGPNVVKQRKTMNLDLAYIEWICWLLGNCAKHWNHHISIFKNIIWKKRLITFFNESSHPPKRTISGWSNIHFLTKENVVMKTAHINQKYYNTKWILSNYWPIVIHFFFLMVTCHSTYYSITHKKWFYCASIKKKKKLLKFDLPQPTTTLSFEWFWFGLFLCTSTAWSELMWHWCQPHPSWKSIKIYISGKKLVGASCTEEVLRNQPFLYILKTICKQSPL